MDRGTLTMLSCESGRGFYNRVVDELRGIEFQDKTFRLYIPNSHEHVFANQEVKTVIDDNIRGDDVYIIQNMDDPLSERTINDNLMILLTAIDAARMADAESVTAVIPQFPYSRQERRKGREGITAKLVAKYLEAAGVNRIITLDIHSEAIQGFFSKAKLENLHASGIFIDHFKSGGFSAENTVIVAPDMGSTERARLYSNALGFGVAVIDKARIYTKASTIESMRLVGNVMDKNVIIVDDMIATGGTLIHAMSTLKDLGAKDIHIAISLPFFNGNGIEKFQNAYEKGMFKQVLGTDAVFWGDSFVKNTEWYSEVSMAPLFAKVIHNINKKQSVSKLLKEI
ncbi:ribose-phosphate pyrophosphokinase [bacterium]|nr:ribose-phosphate pyrophosphokinase [bacterium]